MLNNLFQRVYTQEECPIRKKLNKKEFALVKLHFAMNVMVIIAVGIIIGSMWTLRLHAQSYSELKKRQESANVENLIFRIGAVEAATTETSKKLEHLQSSLDTTQGEVIGAGAMITILQLLGFFVKFKGPRDLD